MKPILRVPLVLLVTAAAVSLGVVGVQASTQCVRFIRQKVRHHKVSAATAARWAVWDKAHPKWHPKRTPQETWDKLNFACEVPVEEKAATDMLPAPQLTAMVLPLEMSAPPDVPTVVALNQPPPDLFPDEPSDSLVSPPIYSPQYPALFGQLPPPNNNGPPPPPSSTPEPSAWVLMATAIFAMSGLIWKRNRTVQPVASVIR